VSILLYRIDDRLIHGQVVVGWGQPLGIRFIVLVDDEVAASDWEQDLYRMAVPPEVEVYFNTVDQASAALSKYRSDPRPGLLVTGTIDAMRQLVERGGVSQVNVGGVHFRAGRAQRLRYVFLTPDEEQVLSDIQGRGVPVTAQDVPGARPISLAHVLAGIDS
jgi:mannose/fructose/N-acetylgalactosamine-specific phosphotransferase system component IIB